MSEVLLLVFVVTIVLIVTAVLKRRRKSAQMEPLVMSPPVKPTVNTFVFPTIQLIHASDAQDHIGELKSILFRMKEENRISDFAAHDISLNQDFKDEDCQGILVMLTNGLGQLRNDIESALKNIIQKNSNVKLIEIIVDNLPYHNDFISLPHDLLPIRSRADMNSVWTGIERDLHAIFPRHEIEKPYVPPPPPAPKTPKKTRIILTALIVPFLIFFAFGTVSANTDDLRLIFFCTAAGLGLALYLIWKRRTAVSGVQVTRQDTSVTRNDTARLRGIVKGFQQRFEIGRFNNKPKIVWTFRIDRYESGKLINTIPVQMVGQSFEGDINDGDEVEVLRWRKGTVLKTNRVKNWTTGIEVKSSGGNAMQALGCFILLVIALIAFLVLRGPLQHLNF